MNTTARYVLTVCAVGTLILGVGFAANALSTASTPGGAPVGVAVIIPDSSEVEPSEHPSAEPSTEPSHEASDEPSERPHVVEVTPSPDVIDLSGGAGVRHSDDDESDHESDHTAEPTEVHDDYTSDSDDAESSTDD